MQKIKRLSPEEKKSLAEDLGIQDGDLVIGHIGRFVPVKNHSFLIELAVKLKQQNIPFKLLLIGDGPLRAGNSPSRQGTKSRGLCSIFGTAGR
ncbi:glycosyltransferase [Lysinibacillus sp. MHQ-1]|nr:glycosyltransferase [Lysinibacillus sp. MHQ-1]